MYTNHSNVVTEISDLRYSLISLDCETYTCSKFVYLQASIAVQIFTIKSDKALFVEPSQDWSPESATEWMERMVQGIGLLLSQNDETGSVRPFPMDTGEQMLGGMAQWAQELEPVAPELEELWMETFLAGQLVQFKPTDFREDKSYEKELRISINDTFWRLLVRCFFLEEKTIEIV